MTRSRWLLPIFAVLLAALMPLEQAHCMWMNVAPARAPACSAGMAGHACCAKAASGEASRPAARHAVPRPAPECPCLQLPPATAPAATVGPLLPPGIVLAIPADSDAPAAPARHALAAPRVDTGPAPPLLALGAHGLRAPPLLG